MAESIELLERTRERMGEEAREAPGPVILLPFHVLTIAAARDVEADAANPAAAVAAIAAEAPGLAANYQTFLEAVNESTPER